MQKPTQDERRVMELTRDFAYEDVRRSITSVVIAYGLFFLSVVLIPFFDLLVIKYVFSVLAGLLLLRCFVIYHDYLHGSILRDSIIAKLFFRFFSIVLLTPKAVWQETHGYHHSHTLKLPTSHIGSFRLITVEQWRQMSFGEKLFYRMLRHPLNMILGGFTVFILGMIIAPFFRSMKKNRDAVLVLIGNLIFAALLTFYFDFHTYFLCLMLPQLVAGAIGSYLFYAQHNFPGVEVKPLKEWSHFHAAMQNSSFMDMHPVMHWFSGNIGYHHIHHLNPRIPFYRLPEAMAAIPELAPHNTTSLRLSDIYSCLKLKLWDEGQQKMVGFEG